MRIVDESQELSVVLSVDEHGHLVGVEQLQAQQRRSAAHGRKLGSKIFGAGCCFALLLALGVGALLMLENSVFVDPFYAGLILLCCVFVLPLAFLGFVWHKVLKH